MASIRKIVMRFYMHSDRGPTTSFINEIVINDAKQVDALMDFGAPVDIKLGEDTYIPAETGIIGDTMFVRYITNKPKVNLSQLFASVEQIKLRDLSTVTRNKKSKVIFTYILSKGKRYDIIHRHTPPSSIVNKDEKLLWGTAKRWLAENEFNGMPDGNYKVYVKEIVRSSFSRSILYGEAEDYSPIKRGFASGTLLSRMRDATLYNDALFNNYFNHDYIWKNYMYVEVTGDYHEFYDYFKLYLGMSPEEVEAKIGTCPVEDTTTDNRNSADEDDDDDLDYNPDYETDVERYNPKVAGGSKKGKKVVIDDSEED